jgi:hypothetical protein
MKIIITPHVNEIICDGIRATVDCSNVKFKQILFDGQKGLIIDETGETLRLDNLDPYADLLASYDQVVAKYDLMEKERNTRLDIQDHFFHMFDELMTNFP